MVSSWCAFGPGIAAVLALGVAAGCMQKPERVIDEAGLFDRPDRQRLALFHELLREDHDIDYRVLTARSVSDINTLAVQRFRDLEVGAAHAGGLGLLLVIDPDGERVRMEVSFGLEGYFPDAFVAYIENRQMLPFFAADRVADGILATTELIVDRAQRYRLGEQDYEENALKGSGGAGATAKMGNPTASTASPAQSGRAVGRSPKETLAAYFEAMSRRDANPELAIYSPGTRQMLRDWVMTPAQMDNVIATYRLCSPQSTRFNASGSRAVIRYAIADRHCAPWFFVKPDEGWLLDLTMMSRAIRFGRDNSWHFDLEADHPYEFAFSDWYFDDNGFPVGRLD